jgi:anti-sigma-K factor RskA
MTKRDEAHLLSGAYALGAVTPEEAELVESAMAESEELRSEVVGLADTAVALGLGLPSQAPPPGLRAKLLDAIEFLPQEAPEEPVADTVDELTPVGAAPVTAMPAGGHVVSRRRRRVRPMVLLASLAAAVVLFGGGFLVQRTLLEPQSEYTAVIQARDAQTVQAPVSGGGIATVSWSKSEHRTAVVLRGVTVPSGKVLQLWTIRSGTATSAGLYQPTDRQRYTVISGTPNSGESLAVTVEPDGGSTQPTTQPIVKVQLNA